MTLIEELQHRIQSIRRGGDGWRDFRVYVEENVDALCAETNLRWLASICDTYADCGNQLERRNAMLISVLIKMEKIAQTYAHWRLGYPEKLGAPPIDSHRKIRLPEGLSSFHLDIGDAPNTMFGRMADMISETPTLLKILDSVKTRLAASDSILGNLDKRHKHVFDNDYSWITSDDYRQYRNSGRIPRHRWERWLK